MTQLACWNIRTMYQAGKTTQIRRLRQTIQWTLLEQQIKEKPKKHMEPNFRSKTMHKIRLR
uniref:Uncharacterized protein n=1 Tax=Arion vulgaris TaxID=1028688 RepID=A0A0B7BG07_9EUPU